MRLKQDWTGFCSAERSDPDLVAAAERHLRFCTHRPIALKLIRHCPALIRRRCPRSSSMQRPERAALQALHKRSILPMASHSTDPESCDVPQATTNRCSAESLAQVRELCTSSASSSRDRVVLDRPARQSSLSTYSFGHRAATKWLV